MLSLHARHRLVFEFLRDQDADNDEESPVDSPDSLAAIPDGQPDTTSPTSRAGLLVIPHSEYDRLSHEFVEAESQSDSSSFRTTATELLPAPLQVNKASGKRFVSSCQWLQCYYHTTWTRSEPILCNAHFSPKCLAPMLSITLLPGVRLTFCPVTILSKT